MKLEECKQKKKHLTKLQVKFSIIFCFYVKERAFSPLATEFRGEFKEMFFWNIQHLNNQGVARVPQV